MTIAQLLQEAKNKLTSVSDRPSLEAEILLAFALNKPRSYLHTWPETSISAESQACFDRYLKRRADKEPIAYITGAREFWSLTLSVNSATLIPRPETELLVELTLKLFQRDNPVKIADLGTGSGAIGLALSHECPAWQIEAVDISENALQIARKNAQQFALKNISFYHGNWCTALPCTGFDAIVSNPPYLAETEWPIYADNLAFEPKEALVSGPDGLEAVRIISQTAKGYLKPGGYLLIEHGFLQAEALRAIFTAEGYQSIHSVRDLAGHERVTIGQCPQ